MIPDLNALEWQLVVDALETHARVVESRPTQTTAASKEYKRQAKQATELRLRIARTLGKFDVGEEQGSGD